MLKLLHDLKSLLCEVFVFLYISKKSLKVRTFLDRRRKNSPLIKVKDAILIRSDKLNKKEVLTKMSKSIDKFLKN